MKTKILSILCAGFIGVSLLAGPVPAAEEAKESKSKEEAKESKSEIKKPNDWFKFWNNARRSNGVCIWI